MKVAILYSDVKREYFSSEANYLTEKDALQEAEVVAGYVKKIGFKSVLIPANAQLVNELEKEKPDIVLNLGGSVRGIDSLSSVIPGILEILNLPFTGAKHAGETLSFNKYLVLKLLEKSEVPVPRYQLILDPDEPLKASLRYPLIAKLNEIHGAVEINQDAVSENEGHLRIRLKKLYDIYHQSILVQEFISGREITGIMFEGLDKEVFLAEKMFTNTHKKFVFATFEHQWTDSGDTYNYRKYKDNQLDDLVKKAFLAAQMRDYGKFDVRLSPEGKYFFTDANSNPAFGPKELQIALGTILDMYGFSFEQALKILFGRHLGK